MCKLFYGEVLTKELGLIDGQGYASYEKKNIQKENLTEKDSDVLLEKFGLNAPAESKKLPHTYWLFKTHKSPIKFRFINAPPKCSIKPLLKAITKIFILFYR